MALLIRAARLLGPRSKGGRLMIQTRQSGHEVLQAALHADPGRLAGPELDRRRLLRLPPYTALAQVAGAAAAEFVNRLGSFDEVEILGPREEAWLVRAVDHNVLTEVLSAVERPPGHLRVQVDPQRA